MKNILVLANGQEVEGIKRYIPDECYKNPETGKWEQCIVFRYDEEREVTVHYFEEMDEEGNVRMESQTKVLALCQILKGKLTEEEADLFASLSSDEANSLIRLLQYQVERKKARAKKVG